MPVEVPGDERRNQRVDERSDQRGSEGKTVMHARRGREMPEALYRHNAEQHRHPEEVLQNLGQRVRVVVLWRRRDDDRERWIYLERMHPGEFSMETVKQRWGGGAYRIRVFGAWDRATRQERYLTQVAFWIWRGFPPTPSLAKLLRNRP